MCEARNFTAFVDEIYGVRREIWGTRLEGEFRATRRRNKIYGVITDDKFFGTALAGPGNFELQNSCVNLRTRNTYEDLKFKGSVNFEPLCGVNFKFKNGASFGLLCSGNVRSLKSRGWANALSLSAAAEISVLVSVGEILKYGVTAGILEPTLASKILIPSIVGKISNLSAVPRADVEFKGAGGC